MRTYSPSRLAEAAARVLENAGLLKEQSTLIAGALVDANVRGHHSHGLMLLPLYLKRIRRGGIRLGTRLEWIIETPTLAVVDANGGPGQLAAYAAAERCAASARVAGISAVAVRNNNHIGMLAAYRMTFQKLGALGLILNIAGPSVAPPGGTKATMGNNAVCLIAPTSVPEPFVIDFATGVVACGKIRDALSKGHAIPTGWLMDSNGIPSADPQDLDLGGAVPVFGGYKGLNVSIMVELLAGVLAGHTVSPLVNRQRANPSKPMNCSQLFIGIDPSVFGITSIDPFIKQLKEAVASSYQGQLPRPVFFPDEQEALSCATARQHGIPITSALAQLLELQ